MGRYLHWINFRLSRLSTAANSLEINGHAARITVRWRFDPVTEATLGATPLELHTDAGGRYVEFNHTGSIMVHWK
jgi:hypothetical protein